VSEPEQERTVGPASRLSPLRSLRLRVPATAMAVFAISLAVASALAFELFVQDGERDIDVVLAREQDRFQQSVGELLAEAQVDDPDAPTEVALERAVRRYLQLNPANESYWTIVTLHDGAPLAPRGGPPELEPLFEAGTLPAGELERYRDLPSDAGRIRSVSVPILVGGEPFGTLQVVSPLEPVRAEALEATGLVAAAAGVSLLLGGILLAASLWRSLSPLGGLADTARSTELRSLAARVEVPDTADEVGILAAEFNTMLDRLEAASQQQRQFMASIGHELRTPITIARGHLELLERVARDDPTAVDETVGIVQDELARMGRLVEDLMAIARSEMEDFARPRDLDLVGWFEDLELKLAGTTAGVGVQILPPLPATLHADPERLSQAVLNLVTNAHVHTPPGTPVRVRAEERTDAIALVVEDQGPGIPAEIREEVFAPFVRAGDAPTSTGLGLSVVKAVVDAHGGSIEVATGDRGTRIALVLPWAGWPSDEPGFEADLLGADAEPFELDGHERTQELTGPAIDPEARTLRIDRHRG
jgi:two-component system, OmpR family, sensor kinase